MYTQRLHAEDLQMERGKFDGTVAYARTKRAEMVLTGCGHSGWPASGVVVHAMHPGWADTPGCDTAADPTDRPAADAQQGADTIVWLAAAAEPARSTGGFWHDWRRRATHRLP
jgi:NAD(P)-dependent dehydrogenase (short-subunit alcohol dehydrogenase family)